MRIAAAYIAPWSSRSSMKSICQELASGGQCRLIFVAGALGSFKLFLKFISKIHGLVRCESPCVLNTQRRHKPESRIVSAKVVNLLDHYGGREGITQRGL